MDGISPIKERPDLDDSGFAEYPNSMPAPPNLTHHDRDLDFVKFKAE